jgi:uncharacterized protein (TIGR02646 family)
MHKLDRKQALSPSCLGNCDPKTHNWESGNPPLDKKEIRESLEQMQGTRCAYCEGNVYNDGHIEHFRRKYHHPHLCFDWSNLFLACGSNKHCGHYKDRRRAKAYKPEDLVKPDEDEPDDYFYAHSTGEIRIRSGISADKEARAKETLRVFNLNQGGLVGARASALKSYRRQAQDIVEALMDFEPDERREFITDEIESTKDDEYWTTIRHFFEKLH